MDRTKIARSLVRIARELVAADEMKTFADMIQNGLPAGMTREQAYRMINDAIGSDPEAKGILRRIESLGHSESVRASRAPMTAGVKDIVDDIVSLGKSPKALALGLALSLNGFSNEAMQVLPTGLSYHPTAPEVQDIGGIPEHDKNPGGYGVRWRDEIYSDLPSAARRRNRSYGSEDVPYPEPDKAVQERLDRAREKGSQDFEYAKQLANDAVRELLSSGEDEGFKIEKNDGKTFVCAVVKGLTVGTASRACWDIADNAFTPPPGKKLFQVFNKKIDGCIAITYEVF